jgi:hypothetical protein
MGVPALLSLPNAAVRLVRGPRAVPSWDLMLTNRVLEFWLQVAIFMPSMRRTRVQMKGRLVLLDPVVVPRRLDCWVPSTEKD